MKTKWSSHFIDLISWVIRHQNSCLHSVKTRILLKAGHVRLLFKVICEIFYFFFANFFQSRENEISLKLGTGSMPRNKICMDKKHSASAIRSFKRYWAQEWVQMKSKPWFVGFSLKRSKLFLKPCVTETGWHLGLKRGPLASIKGKVQIVFPGSARAYGREGCVRLGPIA